LDNIWNISILLDVITTGNSDDLLDIINHYKDRSLLLSLLNKVPWELLISIDTNNYMELGCSVRIKEYRCLLVDLITTQLVSDYTSDNPSRLVFVAPKRNALFKNTNLYYDTCISLAGKINIYSDIQQTPLGNIDNAKNIAIHFKRLIKTIRRQFKIKDDSNAISVSSSRMRTRSISYQSISEGLKRPVSDYILNPVAVPLELSPIEQQASLYNFIRTTTIKHIDGDKLFSSGIIFQNPPRLDLCKQAIGPHGIPALFESLSIDSFRETPLVNHLLLGNNLCGNDLGKYVARFIKSGYSKLTTWYIAGNNLDYEGIAPICEALNHDTDVRQLWLKRNPLHLTGAKLLASMLQSNTYLTVLDVAQTGLMDSGASVIIANIPKNLKVLYLSGNGLTATTCKTINTYRKNILHLEHLGLDLNRFADQGVVELSQILKDPKCLIRVIGLESCAIGPEGAVILADALINNTSLLSLKMGLNVATGDLGEVPNKIESTGAIAISEMLRVNKTLRKVYVNFNNIHQDGFAHLAKTFSKYNTTVLYFNIDQYGIPFNELSKEAINISLKRNRCLVDKITMDQIDYYLKPAYVKEVISTTRVD